MNVTFDTNVLLSATLWDGSVAQKMLFEMIRRGDVTIYTSQPILDEFQRILSRDFDFSTEEISQIMPKVLAFAEIIDPQEKLRVVKDDPDDDAIIECALTSHSHYLITYDPHLLSLKEYQETRIITPEEARATI